MLFLVALLHPASLAQLCYLVYSPSVLQASALPAVYPGYSTVVSGSRHIVPVFPLSFHMFFCIQSIVM